MIKKFTLMELVIVIGLLAVAYLYISPSFTSVQNNISIRTNIIELKRDILETQVLAYEQNKIHHIFLFENGYFVKDEQDNYVKGFVSFNKRVKYIEGSFPNNKITFLGDGTPQVMGELEFLNFSRNNVIKVTISNYIGRINIEWVN